MRPPPYLQATTEERQHLESGEHQHQQAQRLNFNEVPDSENTAERAIEL